QPQKLEAIAKAAKSLEPAWRAAVKAPPTDEENVTALKRGGEALTRAAGNQTGPGAMAAKRLVSALTRLAEGTQAQREQAEAVMMPPLKTALDGMRNWMMAEQISAETLPPEIASDWIKPDGRSKVEVHPRGDPNDNDTLRKFAEAV